MSWNAPFENIALSRAEWVSELFNLKNQLWIEILGLTRVSSDWSLTSRTLSCHYLTLVVDSVNHVRVESANFAEDMGPDAFLWLTPGMTHDMIPKHKDKPHRFYHLRFASLRDGVNLSLAERALYLPRATSLRECFHGLLDASQKPGPYHEARVKARLATLITEAFRLDESSARVGRTLDHECRRRLERMANADNATELSPATLAKALRLNPSYFSRIFKNTYGVSPRTWLTRERMRRAAALLAESTLTVSEVANELGYEDVYVFSKLFKKFYGQAPRHYRQAI